MRWVRHEHGTGGILVVEELRSIVTVKAAITVNIGMMSEEDYGVLMAVVKRGYRTMDTGPIPKLLRIMGGKVASTEFCPEIPDIVPIGYIGKKQLIVYVRESEAAARRAELVSLGAMTDAKFTDHVVVTNRDDGWAAIQVRAWEIEVERNMKATSTRRSRNRDGSHLKSQYSSALPMLKRWHEETAHYRAPILDWLRQKPKFIIPFDGG
jgi:hypothetical protein